MKRVLLAVMATVIMLSVTACAQPVSSSEVLQSDKQRITSPNIPEGDMPTLVEGNSAFAFDLYQALKGEEGNLFYSPYSISLALAMTYGGARGETEQQMAKTLRFILSQSDLHPAFNGLDGELNQRGEGAQGKDEEGFRLNYGAGLRILDFINAPEESRITINDWVSDQTEARIEDLIPQGLINSLTRLVLTNAIYFNAAWESPFEERATADGTFHLLDGSEVTVPMMKQTDSFGYTVGDSYQAVELPYDGGELSMVILLPQADQFEAFESAMNAQQINKIITELQHKRIALTMPKFEFESSFGLKKALAEMGMPVAFSYNADFSGMTSSRDLFIADVVHKAFVSVDEAGTEAAAATAVVMMVKAMPGEAVEVTLDHPFIFLIRDIETDAVLFIGRVSNPNA